jgi:hypothetical protein
MAYRAEFQTIKSGKIPAFNAPFQSAGNMEGGGILDFFTKHEDKLNKTARVAKPLMTIIPAITSIGKLLLGSGEKMSGKGIKEFYNKHKNKLKTAGITLATLATLAKGAHTAYNKFKGNNDDNDDNFNTVNLQDNPLYNDYVSSNYRHLDDDFDGGKRRKIKEKLKNHIRLLKNLQSHHGSGFFDNTLKTINTTLSHTLPVKKGGRKILPHGRPIPRDEEGMAYIQPYSVEKEPHKLGEGRGIKRKAKFTDAPVVKKFKTHLLKGGSLTDFWNKNKTKLLAIGIPTMTMLSALGSIALGDKMIKDKNDALNSII